MAFSLSRTSTLDSSFSSSSRSPAFGDPSAALAPQPFIPPNARRGIRPPKSPSSKHLSLTSTSTTSSLSLPSRPAQVEYSPPVPSLALDILQASPPLESAAMNSYSYAPTAPGPSRGHAAYPRPRTADSSKDPSKPSGVNKMLSAFRLKSSSRSSSKEVPAHVQAVSNAAIIADIQQRERTANSARIKAAAEQLREQGKKVLRAVKRKISSKSPKEEHPQTWDEYVKRYINVGLFSSQSELEERGERAEKLTSFPSSFFHLYSDSPTGRY